MYVSERVLVHVCPAAILAQAVPPLFVPPPLAFEGGDPVSSAVVAHWTHKGGVLAM